MNITFAFWLAYLAFAVVVAVRMYPVIFREFYEEENPESLFNWFSIGYFTLLCFIFAVPVTVAKVLVLLGRRFAPRPIR